MVLLAASATEGPRLHENEENGHQNQDVIVEVIIPSMMGAAIGFVTSEPTPVPKDGDQARENEASTNKNLGES